MKKTVAIICVILSLFVCSTTASADSPLTSTNFSRAYYEVEIVSKASTRNTITDEMAAYLAASENPIDVKAAVINALSWSVDGKNNAELYSQMIYGKSLKELDVAALSADQQFCVGYLLALDDYIDTAEAMKYLRMARSNMSDSLTVAVVTYLVECMNGEIQDWPGSLRQLLADMSLKQDMTEEGIKEITNYVLDSIDDPVDIPKTGAAPLEALYFLGAAGMLAGILWKKNEGSKSSAII